MPVRKRWNALEKWEIALIKAMDARGNWPNNQGVLAYFTRPTRSIIRCNGLSIRMEKADEAVLGAVSE
ncbi:MAG: hypothetical protein J0H77_24745 [Alphaproteobacteria bacterium]|jgi:hypothetical protein|nr:hypothetical protein [Alphaproteobacteria bacterium]MBP8201589.1 hypothetical protein [Nitrospira sp.]